MTKKRIVALLLAGLMTTATLASCRVQGNNPHGNGTEPNQNPPTNQTTPNPENPYNPPAPITWQDVDKSVYTINEVKLRQEASNTGAALATIPKETELHCTKQSTSWYYVEYEDQQGYVSKASVTEANILGTDFVEVTGGSKTMYANAKTINVRLYPSDADFATVVGSFSLNDEVTVLASNGTWYRVKYIKNSVEKEYYVHGSCLSDTQIEDPNNIEKYKDLFTDVEGTPTMYVDNVSQVKFRKAPNTNSDELLALAKGDAVTVLQVGIVDGKEWKYAVVEVAPKKPGDGPTYVHGFISSDCLSYTNGEMTLEDLLKLYPMFKKTDATTMYILQEAAITIRSTPVFPEEGEDNSLSNPQSGKTPDTIKSLKVLANGEVDGTRWFIVEYTKKEGETEKVITGFIANGAMKYLTSDPNGKETVTLEDLMLKYPGQFEKLETPVTVTTKDIANCYGTPAVSNEPLKQLPANASVTLVAKEKVSHVTWAVVQDSEGTLYFVNYALLNQAQ